MSETSNSSRSAIWVVVGLVVVVGVFVLTFLSSGTGGSGYEVEGFGDVDDLAWDLGNPDDGKRADAIQGHYAAVGMVAPEVRGENFNGETVEILNDGNPKIIVFLAHWCGFCQAEVPQLVGLLGGGSSLEGVDFYAVATASNRTRDNWSPAEWLVRG